MALFHIGINASAVCWKTFIGIVWARCFHRVRSDLTSQWILLFYDSVFGSWKLKSKIQNSFFRKYCFVNSNYAPMRAYRSLNVMNSLDPVSDHVCFQRFVALVSLYKATLVRMAVVAKVPPKDVCFRRSNKKKLLSVFKYFFHMTFYDNGVQDMQFGGLLQTLWRHDEIVT